MKNAIIWFFISVALFKSVSGERMANPVPEFASAFAQSQEASLAEEAVASAETSEWAGSTAVRSEFILKADGQQQERDFITGYANSRGTTFGMYGSPPTPLLYPPLERKNERTREAHCLGKRLLLAKRSKPSSLYFGHSQGRGHGLGSGIEILHKLSRFFVGHWPQCHDQVASSSLNEAPS